MDVQQSDSRAGLGKRLVERLTTLSIGFTLAFLTVISLAPLHGVIDFLSGPADIRLDEQASPESIVVLGGGLQDRTTLSRASYRRTVCGVEAFKRTGASLLVLSGGDPMNVGRT